MSDPVRFARIPEGVNGCAAVEMSALPDRLGVVTSMAPVATRCPGLTLGRRGRLGAYAFNVEGMKQHRIRPLPPNSHDAALCMELS